MVSAHWEERPTTLGATVPVPLVYDFVGFPEKYYRTEYAAPGAPDLATRVRSLLRENQVGFGGESDTRARPWGVRAAGGDVPSGGRTGVGVDAGPRPARAVRAGKGPEPATRRGGLGGWQRLPRAQHAIRVSTRGAGVGTGVRRLGRRGHRALRHRGPARRVRARTRAQVALPTWEHYAPLLVAAGAVGQEQPSAVFPITGFWMGGAFTRRSVQFD